MPPCACRWTIAPLLSLLLAACVPAPAAPTPTLAPTSTATSTPSPTSTPTPTLTPTPSATPSPTPGPGLDDLLLTPAAMYLNADLDGAAAAYEALATLYPQRADPFLGLATVALRRGEFEAALGYLQNAAAAEPTSTEAWRQLAVLLEQQARFEEAADAYGRLIDLLPDDPNLYVARAMALARLGRGAEAIADLQAAQSLDPYREHAWLNAAGAAYGTRQYAAAVEVASAGLEAYPRSLGLLILRGQAYLSMGEAQAALADFDAALMLDDRSPTAYRWRGEALAALGRMEEAIAALQQAGEVGTQGGAIGTTEGYEAIARAAGLMAQSDAQAAFEYLAAQVIRYGQPPPLLFGYALIERARGNDQAALSRLNSLIELYDYAPAYLERAQVLAAADEREAAIADLLAFLAVYQAGPQAEAARALLESLGVTP